MLCRHFFAFLLGFVLHIAVLEHGFLSNFYEGARKCRTLLKTNFPLKPTFQKLISRETLALALRLSFLMIFGLNRTKGLFTLYFYKEYLENAEQVTKAS